MTWQIMGTKHLGVEDKVAQRNWKEHTASQTVARPPAVCRVVVTVEIELSQELMKAAREDYMYDSTSVMRAMFEGTDQGPISQMATVAETLDEMRHDGELVILSTKVEATK